MTIEERHTFLVRRLQLLYLKMLGDYDCRSYSDDVAEILDDDAKAADLTAVHVVENNMT